MDLKNKICLVTGSNSGIGKVTALEIAKMGATVVMMARDKKRGEIALEEIKRDSGNNNIELLLCDLSSQKSIREFAKEFTSRYENLHILVNNAGTVVLEKSLTEDAIESTFAINHLGPFLLTNLLLDTIKKSSPARIVNVASMAYKYGHIDFEDINNEKKNYQSFISYCSSKLANILFTNQLAEKLKGTGVTANSLHPGGVNTNIGGDAKGILAILGKIIKLFLISPEKGAETSIYLATSPEVENITGEFFSKKKIVHKMKKARDENDAKRLWELSEKLTNLN